MNLSRLLLMVTALCTLCACSSTNQAGNYSKVNELGETKTAQVRLISGAEFEADLLRVMADSAYFVQPETSVPATVPTGELADITFVNRRKGALKGLQNVLIGSAASILGGFALRSTCNDQSHVYIPDCAAFLMVFLPIVTAPFTIPGGMIIGAIKGDS